MHRLRRRIVKGQEGEVPLHLVIGVDAALQDLLPGDGEEAVLIPGDGVRRLLQAPDEVFRHGGEVLHAHGLGVDAALFLEAVHIVVDAPEPAEAKVDGEPHVDGSQQGADGPPSPAATGPDYGDDGPDHIPQDEDHQQGAEDLHAGDPGAAPHPAQKAPEGGGGGDDGLHPRPPGPQRPEEEKQRQVSGEPDQKFSMLGEKSLHISPSLRGPGWGPLPPPGASGRGDRFGRRGRGWAGPCGGGGSPG